MDNKTFKALKIGDKAKLLQEKTNKEQIQAIVENKEDFIKTYFSKLDAKAQEGILFLLSLIETKLKKQ